MIPRASCYWSEKWRSSTAHRCWLRCKARWMPAPPRCDACMSAMRPADGPPRHTGGLLAGALRMLACSCVALPLPALPR
jgi:hypothetical protein